MDLVIRAVVIYAVLLVLMRAAGNRQFSELTSFDAILIIIISEATQQALIGRQDYSITTAVIVITTLISLDILFSFLKRNSQRMDRLMEGVPVLLVENGKAVKENMKRERVDEHDVMAAARRSQGIDSLEEIRYAVLERNGAISVIPQH